MGEHPEIRGMKIEMRVTSKVSWQCFRKEMQGFQDGGPGVVEK